MFIFGRVVKNFGGFYYVHNENNVYSCIAKGNIIKKVKIIPGDLVNFDITDEETKSGVIKEILPRKNEFIRPAIANVDQLVFIFSLHSPEPDLPMLDKLLIMASLKEVEAVICFNKIDLDTEEGLNLIKRQYENCGVEVISLAASKADGIEELRRRLNGKISVLAGQSGVGKTTIINKLFNNSYRTNDVSYKTKRGRHTTTHVEFMKFDERTYIADTPGFSLVDSILISNERTDLLYPDFEKYLNNCKFSGCIHVNEPECAVKNAVNAGYINKERYARYVLLLEQIKESKKNQRGW